MSSHVHNWTFYPASKSIITSLDCYPLLPSFQMMLCHFTRFWLIEDFPLHGDMLLSSPLQAALTCSCLPLNRTKLFCWRSWSSGIWKETQHSVTGGKWPYWKLDLCVLCHRGTSAKGFKMSTSSRTQNYLVNLVSASWRWVSALIQRNRCITDAHPLRLQEQNIRTCEDNSIALQRFLHQRTNR